jgi:hypothetical protein
MDFIVLHCPAAFDYSVQRRSLTPNTRSDSVFDNPAATAKLTIFSQHPTAGKTHRMRGKKVRLETRST